MIPRNEDYSEIINWKENMKKKKGCCEIEYAKQFVYSEING